MPRPKGSTNKRSFTKQLLQQTEKATRVVEVFEKHGFEVESMEQFQSIASDLLSLLSGTTIKRGKNQEDQGQSKLLLKDQKKEAQSLDLKEEEREAEKLITLSLI